MDYDQERVVITRLDKPKPGPGGHWYYYKGTHPEYEGVIAHGQTEGEVRRELRDRVLKSRGA